MESVSTVNDEISPEQLAEMLTIDDGPQFSDELPKSSRKSGPRAIKPELALILNAAKANAGKWAVLKRGCSKSYQAICSKNPKYVGFTFALRTGPDGVRSCWVMFPQMGGK